MQRLNNNTSNTNNGDRSMPADTAATTLEDATTNGDDEASSVCSSSNGKGYDADEDVAPVVHKSRNNRNSSANNSNSSNSSFEDDDEEDEEEEELATRENNPTTASPFLLPSTYQENFLASLLDLEVPFKKNNTIRKQQQRNSDESPAKKRQRLCDRPSTPVSLISIVEEDDDEYVFDCPLTVPTPKPSKSTPESLVLSLETKKEWLVVAPAATTTTTTTDAAAPTKTTTMAAPKAPTISVFHPQPSVSSMSCASRSVASSSFDRAAPDVTNPSARVATRAATPSTRTAAPTKQQEKLYHPRPHHQHHHEPYEHAAPNSFLQDCTLSTTKWSLEEAVCLSETAHVLVEATIPHRVVHANAAFYLMNLQQQHLHQQITAHPVVARTGEEVKFYLLELNVGKSASNNKPNAPSIADAKAAAAAINKPAQTIG